MLYEKLFPNGMKQYSEKELWEVYDKVGVEVHNRGIEKDIAERATIILSTSDNINEYMRKSGKDEILKNVPIHDLVEMWNEYWDGKRDEQVENEIDDFRMKEDDLVK